MSTAWSLKLFGTIYFLLGYFCVGTIHAQGIILSGGQFDVNTSTAVDAFGNRYVASLVKNSNNFFIQTSKISPQDQILWVRNFAAGSVSVPAGIAVDGQGNAYIAGNDFSLAVGFFLKYDANGVFVSSQPAPNQGPSFSPLLAGIVYDSGSGYLYSAETFLDPNHAGLGSVLVMDCDVNLGLVKTQTINDGPGISDETIGIAVDALGNVLVGEASFASNNPIPDFHLVKFSSGLGGIVSRQSMGRFGVVAQSTANPSGFGADSPIFLISISTADPRGDVAVPQGPMQVDFTWSPMGVFPGSYAMEVYAPDAVLCPWCVATFHNLTTPSGGTLFGVRTNTGFPPEPWSFVHPNPPPGDYRFETGYSFGPFYNNSDIFRFLSTQFHVNMTASVSGTVVATLDMTGTVYDVALQSLLMSILPSAKLFVSTSAGDGQVGFVGRSLPKQLSVLVKDSQGNPKSGAEVDFAISSAPAGAVGQSLAVSSATTGTDGKASVALTLGDIPADYQVTATCPSCAASAHTATFHECGKLDVPFFAQDSTAPWANDTYDDTISSMGAKGCGVSSLAMLAKYYGVQAGADGKPVDPGNLNAWLESNGGYDKKANILWRSIFDYTNGIVDLTDDVLYNSSTSPVNPAPFTIDQLTAFIQQELLNKRPVILFVRNPTTGHQHFILVTGFCGLPQVIYSLNDPGNTAFADWDNRGYVLWGIRRFDSGGP